ncbi:neuroglobin-1-like [Ambystoma mexicanum]|uniref:neuroglobin-1-like n=1 Tax=Ambystoma mexicanum TaxID=8296 RepID=UPI0037E930CC
MGCALSELGWVWGATLGQEVAVAREPLLDLSEQEVLLLRDSWRLIQDDISKLGVIMFVRLFETHPECKDVFFLFRDVDDLQKLRTSKELRTHGLRVMSFVEKSIARIDHPERLEQLALELGKSHYKYNAPPKYYQYVGAEFISAVQPILKEKWTPEVENIWQHLFMYISNVMQMGYQEEERRKAEEKHRLRGHNGI